MGFIMASVLWVVCFAVGILFSTCIIMLGARFAGISNRSFTKGLVTTVLVSLALFPLRALLHMLLFWAHWLIGPLIFLLGIPVVMFFIKSVYDTEWALAMRAWLACFAVEIALIAAAYSLHLHHRIGHLFH
ncbi:MAG: hypothetical protein RDV48_00070 [Candidatus Eremiobacteraeota bacterium]|nr:hypothetical protein [Candidatus Eremiobacteraeota bacterium]